MVEYNKRLVEVDEVLNYLSEDDLMKIPEDVRQVIKDNKDKEYIWKYDESKSLKEQNLSRDTIAILSYLNMEYLLNEKQREFMKEIHIKNEQKKRKEEYSSKQQYNYEDLFKRNRKNGDANVQKEELALVEVKEETFIRKIIKKIKSFMK